MKSKFPVLVVIFVIPFTVLGVILVKLSGGRPNTRQCEVQMTKIVRAAASESLKHSGMLPQSFQALSNSISPEVLICPADRARQQASSWDAFNGEQTTYTLHPRDDSRHPVYIKCRMHKQVGFYDGTVGKKRK
ncbi:MAG: hypothetical protein SGI71_13625 [Verrucomicrobiota bacterium]|nr:hypothetical protein [Verrucomicrobiota bacterium]